MKKHRELQKIFRNLEKNICSKRGFYQRDRNGNEQNRDSGAAELSEWMKNAREHISIRAEQMEERISEIGRGQEM